MLSGDNFWYIHANKFKLSTYVLYWEYYRKIKNWVISNPESFTTIFGKNENSLILEYFLLVSPCHNFW